MILWPKDNDAALDAFFGGRPDGTAKWEVSNLVYIPIPWKAKLAGTETVLAKGIRVNKKVSEDLSAILNEIWAKYSKDQAKIEKDRLDQIGGAYLFRQRRGSRRISNHARGIAIDIDPAHNPMHHGSTGVMPKAVSDTFINHGWRWGRNYGDPMHFEACRD